MGGSTGPQGQPQQVTGGTPTGLPNGGFGDMSQFAKLYAGQGGGAQSPQLQGQPAGMAPQPQMQTGGGMAPPGGFNPYMSGSQGPAAQYGSGGAAAAMPTGQPMPAQGYQGTGASTATYNPYTAQMTGPAAQYGPGGGAAGGAMPTGQPMPASGYQSGGGGASAPITTMPAPPAGAGVTQQQLQQMMATGMRQMGQMPQGPVAGYQAPGTGGTPNFQSGNMPAISPDQIAKIMQMMGGGQQMPMTGGGQM